MLIGAVALLLLLSSRVSRHNIHAFTRLERTCWGSPAVTSRILQLAPRYRNKPFKKAKLRFWRYTRKHGLFKKHTSAVYPCPPEQFIVCIKYFSAPPMYRAEEGGTGVATRVLRCCVGFGDSKLLGWHPLVSLVPTPPAGNQPSRRL